MMVHKIQFKINHSIGVILVVKFLLRRRFPLNMLGLSSTISEQVKANFAYSPYFSNQNLLTIASY